MLVAVVSIEVFVTLAKDAASAIAAGVVIGGFIGATGGVVNGRSRKQVEADALRDGYFGAVTILASWLFNLCIVYAAWPWTN
jgi:hypothetical protein